MARAEIHMPPALLARIDAARGDVSRAAWVRRALEQRLDREERDNRIREKVSKLAEQEGLR